MHLNLLLTVLAFAPLATQAAENPFIGRWDFSLAPGRANWLGVTQKGADTEIWFQPTGGHVHPVKGFALKGSHLEFTVDEAANNRPATVWELDSKDGQLVGVQKTGDRSTPLTGVRAPELKRGAPKAWSKPEPLFDGKSLAGWEPIGDASKSRWVVKDGLMVNEDHGANLKSTRSFTDFKLHFEVNCPDNANSGMYLRGRYEMQLEYVPEGSEPPERGMGSIYGRIAPSKMLKRTPGEWETFDITLVGRTVSISRNGVLTIDRKEIEGITGGALDANEGEPGPFYIQGDHTGGLKFRNITVAVPAK
jgi:hypothetical protein